MLPEFRILTVVSAFISTKADIEQNPKLNHTYASSRA